MTVKNVLKDCDRTGARSACSRAEALVCTLYEGDYDLGVGALVNSLVENGFQGCVAVGYRGELPRWRSQLTPTGSGTGYQVSPGVFIDFIYVDTPIHLSNCKADFMRQLVRERPECKYLCYFDPDIVIRSSWAFYADWVSNGIALCEDINGNLPADHPLRHRWTQLLSRHGLRNPRPLSKYFNGGFVGLPASCSGFLDLLGDLMKIAVSDGLQLDSLCEGDRTNPFNKADQDVLNIAAMYSEYPLTTIGADGMGFTPGAAMMCHAIGSPKPWRKNMVLSALKGVPPSSTDKAYLASATYPIRLYSALGLARRRFSCRLGAFIGRFYRRH